MENNDVTIYLREMALKVDKEIREYLTNKTSTRYLGTLLGRSGYEYDKDAIDRAVLDPAVYLLGLGGKRWRSTLMLTVIAALGKDPKDFMEFAIIPEVIHNGTLLHDDIEDDSKMRRGSEAVHLKYGVDIALNLGDFMFYLPMIALLDSNKLSRDTKINVLETYQRDMLKLSIGQATDIAWHRNIIGPDEVTESQYLQMAYSKTGVLSGMAAKMGAILAGADKKTADAIGHFGATIGVAFQLQDDLLNMSESRLSDLKGGVGEDITEGKITLLTIKTIERANDLDKKRFVEIMKMHTNEEANIKEAIGLIKNYKADEYIKNLEFKLLKDAWQSVDPLIKESESKARLRGMGEFLIERSI